MTGNKEGKDSGEAAPLRGLPQPGSGAQGRGGSIIAGLQERLKTQGAKSLVGNKGYRRFLKTRTDKAFEVDLDKVREEERFDGVLRTDTRFAPGETALRYKQLVEQVFRTAKALHATDLPQDGRNPGMYSVRFSRSCCRRNCSTASTKPAQSGKISCATP